MKNNVHTQQEGNLKYIAIDQKSGGILGHKRNTKPLKKVNSPKKIRLR
jgi:hypothetical protein